MYAVACADCVRRPHPALALTRGNAIRGAAAECELLRRSSLVPAARLGPGRRACREHGRQAVRASGGERTMGYS